MTSDSYFELEIDENDRQATLRLSGEMDMSTEPQLRDAVAGLCEGGAGEIVLDLSQLTFIDSSGVRALVSAQKLCAERGCGFAVNSEVPQPVKRIFEVAGVGELLGLE